MSRHSALPASPCQISLAELIDMRHQLREVQLFSSNARRSPLIGLHHSRLRGRGVDFDQVRLYQPGDDVRSIDWRVTARSQEPHTKLFHEERERPVFILVEQSPRLFFGSQLLFKSVLAAQAASLFAWSALEHNDRIGGLVFGCLAPQEVRPRRSKQSLLQLLARLAKANASLQDNPREDAEAFTQALRRSREVMRPGSLLPIICDERALNETVEQQLILLARHNDLILMPISDPLEHALPLAGLLRFCQGAQSLTLDCQQPALRRQWQAQASNRQARWERLAQQLGVLLLPLSGAIPLLDQLKQHLAQGRPSP